MSVKRKLQYGQADGRGLSYSRLMTAHSCPRKFQLENIFNLGEDESNVDFAFGHAVGAGIQSLVVDPDNLPRAFVECFAAWDISIFDDSKVGKKKTIWHALRAVEIFYEKLHDPATNFLRNYEVAVLTGQDGISKPAVELFFCINCHNGYTYEGHIDLILKEKRGNTYIILELKTTGFTNLHEAMYKNSIQPLGYSIILDSITSELNARNSYHVLYLIYKAGKMEFETMIFPKTRVQRAQFINSLIVDIEILEMYREYGFYPMRGQACYEYFHPCQFIDSCTLSDESLSKIKKQHGSDGAQFNKSEDFDFVFDLEQIRNQQLAIVNQEVIPATNS